MRRCDSWIAAALSLAALGCAPEARPPLEVGYSALRISLPIFVAERRGLFERHGVPVRLRRYETAQPLVEEVLDGRIDAGGFAALPIVVTAVSRGGSPPRLATAMIEDAEHPVSYLLRRAGAAAPRDVADLRGRRVGILPTVAYARWLDAVLERAGVPPSEVTVVPVAPPQQAQALDGGGVDALFTNDPMATAAIAAGVAEPLGDAAPVPRALGGSLVFGSFLVHPDTWRERPDDVRRLVAALDEAIAQIDADQAAARADMRPFVREPERPHVDRYPPARYRRSAELDDASLAREVAAMERLGILDRAPSTRGWVLPAGGE